VEGAVFYTDGERPDAPDGGSSKPLARRDVELASVARARDDGSFEASLPERTLAMRAQIAERVEGALDVSDGDALAAHLECGQLARLDLSFVTHAHELGHCTLLPTL